MIFIRWFLGKIILFLNAIFPPKSIDLSAYEKGRVDAAVRGMALYQFEACPFCVKVRRFFKSASIEIPLVDAKQEIYRNELVRDGGKLQVPCLRIEKNDGSIEWLYESSEIISFLKKTVLIPA